MKKHKSLFVILAIIPLIIATLACGSDSSGEKLGESDNSPTTAPPKLEVFGVGDIIQVKAHTIVLNSAEFQGNILQANFTVENSGTDELNVSTLLSFEAKDDEGTKLEQEIFDCGPGLDGSVLPGDKLKGNVCWSGATTDIVRIYYTSDLFGSGAVVWEIHK